MITSDNFEYILTNKEKARIRYLLEEELPSGINRFEWRFLSHIRDNGMAPNTKVGRAWVHYAKNPHLYDDLHPGESYWEHNHYPDSENDYTDNYGEYEQYCELEREDMED